MGRVYLGEDPDLERQVAIKVMTSSADEEARERFRHEARSIGQLAHPNIVQVHEFGFHGDNPYLVMELLEGADLEQWLISPRPLSSRLPVLRDLCRAVDHAHYRGVLHRDIKPSNVLVLRSGRAKLVDFGIARSRSVQLTATGVVLGTPEYLAPEILSDVRYSPASDLYAVSLVCYRTLSGENPFRAQNLEACLARILTHGAPPLAEHCSGLPETLCGVIDQGLSKRPEDRPEDPGMLERALEEALAALSGESPPFGIDPEEPLDGPTRRLDSPHVFAPRPNDGTTDLPTASTQPTLPLETKDWPTPPPDSAASGDRSEPSATTGRRATTLLLVALSVLLLTLGWWWQDPGDDAMEPPVSVPSEQGMVDGQGSAPGTFVEKDDRGAPGVAPPDAPAGAPDREETLPASLGTSAVPEGRSPDAADRIDSPMGTEERPEDTSSRLATNAPEVTVTPPLALPESESAADDLTQGELVQEELAQGEGVADARSPGQDEPTMATARIDSSNANGVDGRTDTPPTSLPDALIPDEGSPETTDAALAEPVTEGAPTASPPQIEDVTPKLLRRGSTVALVLRGSGFDSSARAVFERGGQAVDGLRIQQTHLDRRGRLRITVAVPHTAPLGPLTLRIVTVAGSSSSPILLEIGL